MHCLLGRRLTLGGLLVGHKATILYTQSLLHTPDSVLALWVGTQRGGCPP